MLAQVQTTTAEQWVETEATILEVHNKIKAKSTRSYATVSYMIKDGTTYESQIELLAVPLFGTTKAVGDRMTVLYDPEKPTLAKTPSKSFIESYGLYLLIGAGIMISLWNLRKILAKTA